MVDGCKGVEARLFVSFCSYDKEEEVTYACKASRLDSINDSFLLFHFAFGRNAYMQCSWGVKFANHCATGVWVCNVVKHGVQMPNRSKTYLNLKRIQKDGKGEYTPLPGSFGTAAHSLDILQQQQHTNVCELQRGELSMLAITHELAKCIERLGASNCFLYLQKYFRLIDIEN